MMVSFRVSSDDGRNAVAFPEPLMLLSMALMMDFVVEAEVVDVAVGGKMEMVALLVSEAWRPMMMTSDGFGVTFGEKVRLDALLSLAVLLRFMVDIVIIVGFG